MWRYEIIKLFRQEYKAGRLKLPPALKHLNSYTKFNAWLDKHYKQTWVVHLSKTSANHKRNIQYLGKYLKRPPIGETRIKKYDGDNVIFEYLDHYTKTKQRMTMPVMEFIKKLVTHIPDDNFRNIRYYGFLANRLSGKLMPVVRTLLAKTVKTLAHIATTWRKMIKNTFNRDPLQCPCCNTIMKVIRVRYPPKKSLIDNHKNIADNKYQIVSTV